MRQLTPAEVQAWEPDPPPASPRHALRRARDTMARLGLADDRQQMGQRWPIGCVALEITQRCNLDCSACYLSEHSEAVRDLPLVEVHRRIDRIAAYYGPGTDVQITGGDPTLRRRDELIAIVRAARAAGLRPTLMTNGIRATPALLADLAAAGLVDVAFHVDTTQARKGHPTERALNRLRVRYLEAARDAGLSVMFNTTVHAGNFDEIPDLVGFFRANARDIRTASFQLQADTGRGVLGRRGGAIDADSVTARIRAGADCELSFDSTRIGHPGCTRYALGVVAGGEMHDLLADAGLVARVQAALADVRFERDAGFSTVRAIGIRALRHPRLVLEVMRHAVRRIWQARAALQAAGAGVTTLSFMIHDFMDAGCLDCERVEACVFKVMTGDGPVSMCLHNAKRDSFILKPVAVNDGASRWDPLTGRSTVTVDPPSNPDPSSLPLKRLKGRSREAALGRRGVAGAGSG